MQWLGTVKLAMCDDRETQILIKCGDLKDVMAQNQWFSIVKRWMNIHEHQLFGCKKQGLYVLFHTSGAMICHNEAMMTFGKSRGTLGRIVPFLSIFVGRISKSIPFRDMTRNCFEMA